MNRLRYTHIYTLLFTLGAILASTSCVRDYNTLECEDDGNKYLSLTLSLAPSGNDGLRMQGDDYSINSDKTNREDYVNDLRIFLIQNGVIKKNVFFTNLVPKYSYDDYSSGSEDDGVSYNYKSGKAQVTFRLKENELGKYDLVVVANEGAYTNPPSLDPGPDRDEKQNNEKWREEAADAALRKALREAKTIDDLKKIRIPVTRRFSDTHQGPYLDFNNPYIKVISPMTAEYKDVPFTEGGTKDNPRVIQLPNPHGRTKGVELLRTFAKVEVTMKECVLLTLDENGKEHLQWRGPWGFQGVDTYIRKMPTTTSLFPLNEYYNKKDTIVNRVGRLLDDRGYPLQTDFIVDYKDKIKEIKKNGFPVGGGYLFDYRLYFYLPEKLVPQGADGDEKALYLLFEWGYYGAHDPWKDMAGDHKPIIKEEIFHFDSHNAGASKYLDSEFKTSSKSVYRNSLYKITIIPYKLAAPK